MCNCGKKREDYRQGQSSRLSAHKNIEVEYNKIWSDVYFEYTGLSSMSVTGRISGKHYRFGHPGNIQPIDYRDVSGMLAVPVLKKVNKQ